MIDHEARKQRLGASEVAAILGENPDMTPLEVWEVKTGRRANFQGNEHTRRGNRQEQSILDWLEEDLGGEFAIGRNIESCNHPTSQIASATPDGIVMRKSDMEDGVNMSAIPARSMAKFLWQAAVMMGKPIAGAEAKSTLKRIKFIEDLPITWLIQCQWGMLCTGLKTWHLAIHGPMVSDYQRFEIAYDEKFALELLAMAEEWWEKHIAGDVQPEPINTSDVLHLWPVDDGSIVEAVQSLAEAIEQYKALGTQISVLQKERDSLKDRITPAIGGASMVTFMGQKLATYKYQSRAGHTVEAVGGRVLRV